jgi:hypothetical protein
VFLFLDKTQKPSVYCLGEITMRMRNSFWCVAVLAMLAMGSGIVWADTVIGVNFTDGWGTPCLAGETADGLSNWTDTRAENDWTDPKSGTGLVVLGSNGSVTCDWTSANTWAGGQEGTSEQQLYRVYLDDGGDGCLVTIHGLNAWMLSEGLGAYKIRIYFSTDWNSPTTFEEVEIKEGATVLETVQETNRWYTDGGTRANVDSGLLMADTIVLDPATKSGNTRACIAGFKITGINKFIPLNPDPAVGEQVQLAQVLSWQQAPAANGLGVTYNVYFGEDNNSLSQTYYGLAPDVSGTSEFSYAPTLANSKTYYWRVDAIEPNIPNPVIHTGPEWWFTTVPPNAFVTVDPVSRTVPAGTPVTLTVAGENITEYQWYKDGVLLTDETAATLTIGSMQLANEGFYYCEVDNSLDIPDISASAQLMTERLVGWWKLDGDLTDSVGEAIPGAAAHDGTCVDPNFVGVGKDNGALKFFGDAGGIVSITDSAEYFNFYPLGYTVSAWVNMPEKVNSPSGAFVCMELREGTFRGFVLSHAGSGGAVHTLRQSFNDLGANMDVDDNAWHLVVGTYDAVAKQGKIYVDGVLRSQATNTGTPQGNSKALIFGAEIVDATVAPYSGLMDDVRIWSYPIDAQTIANLYTDFNPGVSVCIKNPALDTTGPDGVPDCKVDLYEFAQVAEAWLECGLSPADYCAQ